MLEDSTVSARPALGVVVTPTVVLSKDDYVTMSGTTFEMVRWQTEVASRMGARRISGCSPVRLGHQLELI